MWLCKAVINTGARREIACGKDLLNNDRTQMTGRIQMKVKTLLVSAALAAGVLSAPPAADAQTRSPSGNVEAGRSLALEACTSCHVVAADQPFKPIYTGTPRPPNFKDIADGPNVTAASLEHHLQTLPTIPANSRMANPALTDEQCRDVVAFILSLRTK